MRLLRALCSVSALLTLSCFDICTANPEQAPAVVATGQGKSSAAGNGTGAGFGGGQSGSQSTSASTASANAFTNVVIENPGLKAVEQKQRLLALAITQLVRDVIKVKVLKLLISRSYGGYKNLMKECGKSQKEDIASDIIEHYSA